MRGSVLIIAACLAGALTLAAAAAMVQTGRVTANGQPVPGATVIVSEGAQHFEALTNEAGQYQFDQLAPGKYSIEVRMFGFQTARREITVPGSGDIQLHLEAAGSETARGTLPRPAGRGAPANPLAAQVDSQINAQLNAETGAVTPPATENAESNEAFLVSGSLSRGLQSGQIDAPAQEFGGFRRGPEGPNFGGPGEGTAPGFGAGAGGAGGAGGRGFGGGGGRFGGRGGQFAGRRRPGGGQGNFFGNRARRGREGIRGAVFFSTQNSSWNARPFSFSGQSQPQPGYSQQRFGVTAGGPLVIPHILNASKTFFFLNYNGTRASRPYLGVATVPTALERAGDFSQALNASALFDPLTHQGFPGGVIPPSRINPASAGLLQFVPLPNQPGLVQNYQLLTVYPQNTDNFGVRFFHNLTSDDRVGLALNVQHRDSKPVQLFGFQDETSGFGASPNVSWTRNINPRTINTLHVMFNRNSSSTLPYFADGTDVAGELGIAGTSRNPINFGPPNLSFTNFGALTDASPVRTVVQSIGFSESVLFVRGTHTITAGGEYHRNYLDTRTDQNGRGTFTFTGLETSEFSANGLPLPGTGYDMADFLLGLPQTSSIRFGDTSTYFHQNSFGLFAQDDWHATANFTFNAGLRYEYTSPFAEKYGHISNLDLAPAYLGAAVVTPGVPGPYSGAFPAGLINPDWNRWAPRVGLAWKPLPKHSLLVRAAYGIYYNPGVYNQFTSLLASQPPFAQTATLSTSLANVLTVQNGFATAPSAKAITNTFAVDRDYRVPYAQTWTFFIQQDLPHAFIVEAGYIGTKGTRLDIETVPNRAAQGSPLTSEQRRQILDATAFTLDSSQGNSIYNAAQIRVMRRFRRGISLSALYTYSKSIDDSSTFGGVGNTVAQNYLDLAAERGLSSFDQRHTLRLNYLFSTPNSSHWYVRDWSLSGGLTAASGTPFTARVLGNQADTGGTGIVGSGRAEATGLPVDSGLFFNPLAYTTPPPGHLGNAGRNTIPGIAQWTWNSALARNIPFGDGRKRLEIRLEANNLLNHVNYTNVSTVVNAIDYGLPTAAGAMRTLQANVRFRF